MLDILCCKITVGDADPANPMKINNPITLTEVSNIEITESYKELIGTATVSFPKGTVFKSTIIGNATIEGADASVITTDIMGDGVIVEKRTTSQVMNETTFSVGQRINIALGYNGVLKNLFSGYITAFNSDSQFSLKCENMAYKLKLKQSPKFETSTTCSVNDILGEKYGLLKDTGFEIHTDTKKFDIKIGKVKITDNFTVADILNDWSKYKLYSFLKYDENNIDSMPAIAIGRPYSSSKSQPAFPTDSEAVPFKIYFNYHVASSNLKAIKISPKFLAITGKSLGKDEKFFEVTVRLNPDYDSSVIGSKEFQTVNATQISTKSQKVTGNKTAEGAETQTQVDLSTYTVMPYMSPNIGITSDALVEETIEYFKNYNLNGIEGSLTIFGDLALTTACQVELIDNRNPSKNGTYIVEEVKTSFGTGGYRQSISLSHKINKQIWKQITLKR